MWLPPTVVLLAAAGLLTSCGRDTGQVSQVARSGVGRTPGQPTRRPGMQRRGGMRRAPEGAAELPTGYETIAKENLFRPLGWEESRENPFGLAGIVQHPDGPRALVTRQDRPGGLYVLVGADVGDGYTVAAIDGRSVKLLGGALGEVSLELDSSVVGSRGGGGGGSTKIQGVPGVETAAENVTWRPPRGLGKDAFWALLLKREGITMQQVRDDPELRADLNVKYKYLVDEGYVTW